MLNRERKREIISLRTKIEHLDRLSQIEVSLRANRTGGALNQAQNFSNILAQASTAGSLASDLLQIPAITNFLPHLLNSADPLRPAFRRVSSTSVRGSATIVLGLPTVKRPVESYLLSTLANLIVNMSPAEAASSVIVVFIAEVS